MRIFSRFLACALVVTLSACGKLMKGPGNDAQPVPSNDVGLPLLSGNKKPSPQRLAVESLIAASKTTGRPVMIHLEGAWCAPCFMFRTKLENLRASDPGNAFVKAYDSYDRLDIENYFDENIAPDYVQLTIPHFPTWYLYHPKTNSWAYLDMLTMTTGGTDLIDDTRWLETFAASGDVKDLIREHLTMWQTIGKGIADYMLDRNYFSTFLMRDHADSYELFKEVVNIEFQNNGESDLKELYLDSFGTLTRQKGDVAQGLNDINGLFAASVPSLDLTTLTPARLDQLTVEAGLAESKSETDEFLRVHHDDCFTGENYTLAKLCARVGMLKPDISNDDLTTLRAHVTRQLVADASGRMILVDRRLQVRMGAVLTQVDLDASISSLNAEYESGRKTSLANIAKKQKAIDALPEGLKRTIEMNSLNRSKFNLDHLDAHKLLDQHALAEALDRLQKGESLGQRGITLKGE